MLLFDLELRLAERWIEGRLQDRGRIEMHLMEFNT